MQDYKYKFCFIKNEKLEKLNELVDRTLSENKSTTSRPYFMVVEDKKNKEIMWAVPISHKVTDKYRDLAKKHPEKIFLADVLSEQKAFLLQNIAPITKDYIERIYKIKQKPVELNPIENDILQKRVEKLLSNPKRLKYITFTKPLLLRNYVEKELEQNRVKEKEVLKDLTLTRLKERLPNIDTELKTLQNNKPMMQSRIHYTKKAYDILTQGESTKLAKQIKDARHIRNPSDEIKKQIESCEKKIDEIIAKYPDKQVSNLINDLKSQDEEKTRLFNLTCKELNNEKTAINSILSQSPDKLSATLDKTIQERSEQNTMLTSLKDKATNIVKALVEWQNDAVLKDTSKEATKKNDLER